MLGHKISKKDKTELTDFVNIYCDHRDSCENRKCPCKSLPKDVKLTQENVAFSEKRKCVNYRSFDELGAIREATIKEVGVWK